MKILAQGYRDKTKGGRGGRMDSVVGAGSIRGGSEDVWSGEAG